MRLLVVEDERALARHLQRGLEEAAWTVDVCERVEDAWRLVLLNAYDLILLDLGLPDQDGGELLRRLRAGGHSTPVLILTARGGVDDRIAGLNAGADDYLGKPFAFGELLARINALLRRGHQHDLVSLQVADLTLDVRRRQARRGERRIDLTAREFSLLEFLMRHAGNVVTRKMLCEHLWESDWEGVTNVIEVHINRLRGKIDKGYDTSLIQTVRGRGYALHAPE
jgi:two-component system, OmpR family, response regulator